MQIFNKEINIKDYNCSRNGILYPSVDIPYINLYVQITPKCNAQCRFCNTHCHSLTFDFAKFQEILDELSRKVIIGKVAITGGEPLLIPDRVIRAINMASKYNVTLNTNAYNLDILKEIYPIVKEIHISKHHYNNQINDTIMGIHTPSLMEIYDYGFADKVKINCVWQKEAIETKEDMIQFMEVLSHYGYKEIRNISLLPLTQYAKDNCIDLTAIMTECESYLNDGYMYDKNMCKCFEFIYIAKNKRLIKSLIRHTYNDDYSCVKQLVFDGKNLYDGFKKNNIIY